jgi:hypothetical protein
MKRNQLKHNEIDWYEENGGSTKLRSENETKRNEMKRNTTKRNMKKRSEAKRNEMKLADIL